MIDLESLAVQVGLPVDNARQLIFHAAIALERRHRPGVRLRCEVDGDAFDEELQWQAREPAAALYEDIKGVTAGGAEAIALALAGSQRSWRVIRRLQSQHAERADWLLLDSGSGAKVVLEVGGTDEGDVRSLLRRKIEQANTSPFAAKSKPAACVVRFAEPLALLWSHNESV